MRLALLVVIAALGLVGCQVSGDPVPADRFYRVAVPAPAAAATFTLPGTLSVDRLDADGLMRERPVVYSVDEQALSLSQHGYDFWIEPPARMVQAELVRYLRSAGAATTVVTPELRVPYDFEIVGTVRRFERLIGRSEARVAVVLDLALIDRHGDRLHVGDTYAAEVACSDATVDGAVSAFNLALAAVYADFLADMTRGRPAI